MRHRTLAVASSAAVLVAMVIVPQAQATTLGPPPVEDTPSASSIGDGSISIRPPRPADAQDGIETSHVTSPIAPGLRLTEFDRFNPDGWVRGDVLTADLAGGGPQPIYLHPGTASARTPLSEQANRMRAVAGVNGDFFDIDATGASLGVGIGKGELLHAPGGGHNHAATASADAGRLMQVFLDAKLTRADGSAVTVNDLNAPKVSSNGVALYTPFWGAASRQTAVEGASRVTEVEVTNGVVTRVGTAPAEGPVPGGAVRLLGVDGGADVLGSMRVGERAGVKYRPRAGGGVPQAAVGGNKVLLKDGAVQPVDDAALHPRTAAGFSADGKRMWLVTVDGRQADSRGMTEVELAEQLKLLGAADAINLDGGGSSTLLAREQGDSAPGVHNSPSDGEERPVPNGIGFSALPGSGRLTGFRVEPAHNAPYGDRVLSGLTRQLRAYGHDEVGGPVAADPMWTALPPGSGRVREGTFHAGRPGDARVTAVQGAATGEKSMTVLGPLARLATSTERVQLSGNGAQGRFQVLGYDSNGFGTWVQPSDVRLEYDPRLVRISPDRDGFAITALAPAASVVTARVGGHVTHFGVTVGSEPHQLSPMDGVHGWRSSAHPESVRASLAEADGRAGTPGLALDYALTGSTATRAAYVNAERPLRLPAGTQKVGLWVQGDGRGGWLRATLGDSTGVSTTVDLAPQVNWTGWRYVEAAIPPGLAGELQLQRLYVVEPDAARQYEGRLVFDDLTVAVAPEVHVPEDPEPRDASVVQDGTLPPGTGTNRVAVVSDSQFTADDPDGPLVQQARRSLREALATRPDLIVLNGDFVDRGTAADFDLARKVLDSELGGRVPWYYVPGNHETYGPGNLSEFSAEFGPTHRVFDSRSTRFVLLDSSLGSLREGGFGQVRMLRDALAAAAADPTISSVAVFMHHPIDDPAPGDASELSDRKEADLLTKWLADFERNSGKPAVATTAHAGMFHSSTVDGVQYQVNGNSGKAPAVAPDNGGFTGSSLLRIDPRNEKAPIHWETRPHIDELRLTAPDHIARGEQQPVRSELVQAGRAVPVAYPVSADWWGSPGLHIGPPSEAGPDKVVAFDPATGMVTGLRPGTEQLSVTVNGVTRTVPLTVTQ